MKRILLMMSLMFMVLTINAQKRGFVCTGKNVNLRTGPGKNYNVVYDDLGNRIYADQVETITDLKQKKNGFCKVSVFARQRGDYTGWISAKYLKPVRFCSRCDGLGYEGDGLINLRTCPKCHGRGY